MDAYDLVLDASLGEATSAAENKPVWCKKSGSVNGEGGKSVRGMARAHGGSVCKHVARRNEVIYARD